MAFSKKHYMSLSKRINMVLRDQLPVQDSNGVKAIGSIIIVLAEVLKRDNPNFDHARFYDACLGKREM